MSRMTPSRRLGICAAALAAALLALPPLETAAQSAAPRLLGGVERLKSWFNANRSHVKAILLLSPT